MTHCAPATTAELPVVDRQHTRIIALAGQPNIGKSTIFNALTGLNQHVGNWPGKTVESKMGAFSHKGNPYRIVDLPGTYSLTANSPEELITRDYLLTEKPDLVVAVISAANLERSLYLLAELVCLPIPIVIALNMMDVAVKDQIVVKPEILEANLGIPVIPISATRQKEIHHLLNHINDTFGQTPKEKVSIPTLPDHLVDSHRKISILIESAIPPELPSDWVSLKLLESDAVLVESIKRSLQVDKANEVQSILANHPSALIEIASSRYEWISQILSDVVRYPDDDKPSSNERIDRITAHPIWGLFVLAAILGLVFWLTFQIGAPIQSWMDTQLLSPISQTVSSSLIGAPFWIRSLLVDGILGGVGSVLTFLPILMIFFASFGILEDVGYMARAAYVMDNLMQAMGLQGRSFLPLFLGFGCNVPAIMGTRVIDSKPARLLTILIAPLIPCTARMAVVAFIAPAFFGANATLVTWGLVIFSMLIMVLLGILLNRVLFKGERASFIMELPSYHIPNPRTIGLLVWQRSLSFIQKAGTIILGISVFIWLLTMLPTGNLETSYLARIGQFVSPVGEWMGFDWKLSVAILTSFLAKENAIATLGVLFGGSGNLGLTAILSSTYSVATALSFLVVTLLFIPCAATVATIKQETNSWRWTLGSVGIFLVLSVLVGTITFRLVSAAGL